MLFKNWQSNGKTNHGEKNIHYLLKINFTYAYTVFLDNIAIILGRLALKVKNPCSPVKTANPPTISPGLTEYISASVNPSGSIFCDTINDPFNNKTNAAS